MPQSSGFSPPPRSRTRRSARTGLISARSAAGSTSSRLGLEDVDARVLTDYAATSDAAGRRGLPRPRSPGSSPQFARCSATRSAPVACPTSRSRRAGRSGFLTSARPTTSTASCRSLEGEGPIPLRNRALGELVYSAGLRSKEAVELDLEDVDFEQETVRVLGKGGKGARRAPRRGGCTLARPVPARRPSAARAGCRERALRVRPRPPARHEHAPPRHPPSTPPPSRVRHASPGGRRRPPCDPGAARAQLAVRRRRCTATWTDAACAACTTARTLGRDRPGRHHRVERRRDARRPGHPRRQLHPARRPNEQFVRDGLRLRRGARRPLRPHGRPTASGSRWSASRRSSRRRRASGLLREARLANGERGLRRARAVAHAGRADGGRAGVSVSDHRLDRDRGPRRPLRHAPHDACADTGRPRQRRGAHGGLAVASACWLSRATTPSRTAFHWPFFEGDTWRFEETDTLRRLYPDRFWLDVAVAIGVVAAVQAAILFLIAKLWARRAGVRRPLRMQARTEGT